MDDQLNYYTENELMGYSGHDELHKPAVPAIKAGYDARAAEERFRSQLAKMADENEYELMRLRQVLGGKEN